MKYLVLLDILFAMFKCHAGSVFRKTMVDDTVAGLNMDVYAFDDTSLLKLNSNLKFIESILPIIQTDRPDQTECPFIVPKNHFQMESGFNYEKVNIDEQNFFYPSTLWKFGINNNLELRLITELNSNKFNEVITTGVNPVKIGFKTNLWKQKGVFPLTSFIGHLSIPNSATNQFKTSFVAPDFRFTMQHTLNNTISIAYNLGAEWDGENANPSYIYTLTSGFSLTNKIGIYFELYGFTHNKKQNEHRADGGITYNLRKNILLDVSGGFGLSKNAPNHYVSLGFSVRFPN